MNEFLSFFLRLIRLLRYCVPCKIPILTKVLKVQSPMQQSSKCALRRLCRIIVFFALIIHVAEVDLLFVIGQGTYSFHFREEEALGCGTRVIALRKISLPLAKLSAASLSESYLGNKPMAVWVLSVHATSVPFYHRINPEWLVSPLGIWTMMLQATERRYNRCTSHLQEWKKINKFRAGSNIEKHESRVRVKARLHSWLQGWGLRFCQIYEFITPRLKEFSSSMHHTGHSVWNPKLGQFEIKFKFKS